MTLSISKSIRDQLVGLYPAEVRPLVDSAIPEFELQAARLALEVLDVERSKVPFKEAVRRPGDWPLMSRVHHGILDILQLELSAELQDVLRALFAEANQWAGLENLRRLLACYAATTDQTAESALARFALYEAIRLNLWVAFWDSPEAEALGCLEQLDRDAEFQLRERLRQSELFDDEVRPLNVLVAEAALRLLEKFEAINDGLALASSEFLEYIDGLTDAARTARNLRPEDAAVLRNDYASHVGGTKLESLLLSEQHPLLFTTPGAVDVRRSRLRKKLSTPRQKTCSLVDLLRE